jgi:diadenosine tetraphosphate (Ap4A) HIT family hydrolase
MFTLHPALEASSAPIVSLGLSEARLQLDARFPWIVLVPRVPDAGAMDDLTGVDQARLLGEILAAGRAVQAIGEACGRPIERPNIGVLGNITPQLHVHVVGRRSDDAAWPGPVWGHGVAEPYEAVTQAAAIAAAVKAFSRPNPA